MYSENFLFFEVTAVATLVSAAIRYWSQCYLLEAQLRVATDEVTQGRKTTLNSLHLHLT